ncbi:helix-turn-helix domain-containing protein [Clostridium perfringens]|uniref:helix-turn-helix domain-containing protein n=1 Tax=Clostridium perfringens TaxID=1502 RepID=UPI0037543F99
MEKVRVYQRELQVRNLLQSVETVRFIYNWTLHKNQVILWICVQYIDTNPQNDII